MTCCIGELNEKASGMSKRNRIFAAVQNKSSVYRVSSLAISLDKMGLSQIRRDYFDPQSAHVFSAHKLEVWPGFVTTIKQHEEKILLCCELGNKVLRTDTVLDQLKRFQ